jgi:ribosomal protein S18 acetylase RimI-like enzyme
MTVSLRPAFESDAPSLSHICLLTGAAGFSAEALHDHGELPGLVYAVPYVKLPTTFGFIIFDDKTSEVVGYVLGSSDTRTFEHEAEEHWWPALRAKYPIDGPGKIAGKEADEHFMKLFQKMPAAPDECIVFSRAHLHIDILPGYQRQGWGKKLIGCVVDYLRAEKINSVWVGLDPKNENAKKFYRKLGFEDIEAPGTNMGLHFDNWRM